MPDTAQSSSATILSATLSGVDARRVVVQAHVAPGDPSFTIVGMPDGRCRETRDRVRAAFITSGLSWPLRRVTITLQPPPRITDSGLDLPIALAVLAASGTLPASAIRDIAAIGELNLDGSVRHVAGVVSRVEATIAARSIIVPAVDHAGANLIRGAGVKPVPDLKAAAGLLAPHAAGHETPKIAPTAGFEEAVASFLHTVRTTPAARRAVAVAAAGGHHLLLVGPRAAGAPLLAGCIAQLLPPLAVDEGLEVARIHSAAGAPGPSTLPIRPPLRAPHHRAPVVALIGGAGQSLRPGELSLAHRGVLFLDRITEFPAPALDSLAGALEQRSITLQRARLTVRFPAQPLLVGAMTRCPCDADDADECRCSSEAVARFSRRLPGRLLSRIDLRVRLDYPSATDGGGAVAELGDDVTRVRALARARGARSNAELTLADLDACAALKADATAAIDAAVRAGSLTGGGATAVRRVARTIADLDGSGDVGAKAVLEAIAFRRRVPVGHAD